MWLFVFVVIFGLLICFLIFFRIGLDMFFEIVEVRVRRVIIE